MKKILAIVLIVCLSLTCFVACGSKEEAFYGTWTGTVTQAGATGLPAPYDFIDAKVDITLAVNEDGTYDLSIESAESNIQAITDFSSEYVNETLEAQAEAASITVEELYKAFETQMGMSVEDYMATIVDSLAPAIEANNQHISGDYSIKSGALVCEDGGETSTFELDGDKLVANEAGLGEVVLTK